MKKIILTTITFTIPLITTAITPDTTDQASSDSNQQIEFDIPPYREIDEDIESKDTRLLPCTDDEMCDFEDDQETRESDDKNISKTPMTIPCNQIATYAKNFVQKFIDLTAQTTTTTATAKKQKVNPLEQKIDTIITSIENKLTNYLEQCSINSIHKTQLNYILKSVLAPFLNKYPNARVVVCNLVKAVDRAITIFFKQKGTCVGLVPKEMKDEFATRRTALIIMLRSCIYGVQTNPISCKSINASVKDTYEDFIKRMKRVELWNKIDEELSYIDKDKTGRTPSSTISIDPELKKKRERQSMAN